jgi:hypothetical protein
MLICNATYDTERRGPESKVSLGTSHTMVANIHKHDMGTDCHSHCSRTGTREGRASSDQKNMDRERGRDKGGSSVVIAARRLLIGRRLLDVPHLGFVLGRIERVQRRSPALLTENEVLPDEVSGAYWMRARSAPGRRRWAP